jgi:hypothetical protein
VLLGGLTGRYPPGHPLAWLEDEAASAPLSEERRRELIELGFPGGCTAAWPCRHAGPLKPAGANRHMWGLPIMMHGMNACQHGVL